MKKKIQVLLLLFVLICFPLTTKAEETGNVQETCQHEWSDWTLPFHQTGCIYYNVTLTRTCSKCHLKESKTEATYGSHSWGKWRTYKKATPWATGKKYRNCSRCGLRSAYEVIPKRKMNSQEKKCVTLAKKFMANARTYNVKKMQSCFASKQDTLFVRNNPYMISYIRTQNKKKLTAKPYDITIIGKKMVVTFWISYPDGFKPLSKACSAMNWNHYSYATKAGQKKQKYYVKKYTKVYGVPKTNKYLNIYLRKTSKGWKLANATENVRNAINCNYPLALTEAK